MKTCAKCKQQKQPSDFYASKRFKDGRRTECKQCDKKRALDWHKNNPEKSAANNKEWHERNPEARARHRKTTYQNNIEKSKADSKKWKQENKEKRDNTNAIYRQENRESLRLKQLDYSRENVELNRQRMRQWAKDNPEKMRERNKEWRKAHPEISRNRVRLRRAQLSGAKVKWANKFIMRDIYDLARLRTKATGIAFHVDHIVPIKHKLVCGLHCEANLQVIEGLSNCRKSNRHWPDMP